MIVIILVIFLLLLLQTWVFCMAIHKDSYEQEISDREQEEYLKNWTALKKQKKKKQSGDL